MNIQEANPTFEHRTKKKKSTLMKISCNEYIVKRNNLWVLEFMLKKYKYSGTIYKNKKIIKEY